MMYLMINCSSKWWYKLITIILVFALIIYFSIGFAPKASAIVVSTVIVGSVLAAMAATGIGLAVSGMTAQELTQWVSDKLNDWTTDIGGTIQDHINNNLITVTASGVLAIGSAAAQGISDFISWLKNEDSLQDNTTTVIQNPSVTLNGYQLGLLPVNVVNSGMDITFTSTNETYVYYRYAVWAGGTSWYNAWFISPQSSVVTQISNGEVTTTNVNQYRNGYYYSYSSAHQTVPANGAGFNSGWIHEETPPTIIGNGNPAIVTPGMEYVTQTISIPNIGTTEKWFLDVGADAGEDVDTVTDGVITDTITNSLDVSSEVAEPAQEVVIVNEDAIAVNVDHHMIGFSNLPDFAHLNLNSIWHYVSDAVNYASSWLSWFVSFLTAMPLLAIPLYMSFTLLVVLSFLRRFI